MDPSPVVHCANEKNRAQRGDDVLKVTVIKAGMDPDLQNLHQVPWL